MPASMLTLEEAQTQLARIVTPTGLETIPVRDASGRYSAADVLAKRTQPPADLSAMDGFAVAGAGPWTIVGESRCGAPFAGSIAEGQATRISTGAVMPNGAEGVLIKENAELSGDDLIAQEPVAPGNHIRRKGFDFAQGARLRAKGERIGPAGLALLLAGGICEVTVHTRPLVTIFECGDELAEAEATSNIGTIPASNGAMLAAMCRTEACTVATPPPLPDRLDAIARAIDDARDSDLIIVSGGASVGDHDLVRPALEEFGASIDFWRVAMKPGKPLMAAKRGRQLILGLPGNPVSSYVTGYLFALPAIRAMLGATAIAPQCIHLPAGDDLPAVGARREFVRARLEPSGPVPLDQQDSSGLAALAAADCLIERPEGCAGVKAGTPVPVYLLGNGGIA
ncbi:molybdopterin molybdotransferase MoeA [Parerythrobacter lacustris]|uniref:Molybdopterin molybdenumtransferase n=1 Tax=Parerythrobacter lacustris TaxID=2969984 RepID=A0ABT1XQ37_9SPHN|nr:molybdopterin molybdotransferase MoeA [Parerythrobacter lacustris]MCR2833756.1 molybdopterin molybdotransferase MoeA [Parerythrobacter lacustris]